MFPRVCSRLPNGRWAADRVAASSRQYEAPVMPHSMITNVTTGGSAIIQRGPASKSARPASPRLAPAPAGWPPETTGWVLGEVTAQCLPGTGCCSLDTMQPGAVTGATRPGRQADADPGSGAARQVPRMARSDSRSDPIVASTADGSYPQCAMQFAHRGSLPRP